MNRLDFKESNPFATRFIRPGAITFLFPAGESAESLVNRLQTTAWRGAIVGPHGAGKSSLLLALAPVLTGRGKSLIACTLHDGELHLPRDLAGWRTWSRETLIVVDGYEQLSWWSRVQLSWRCYRRGAGLLVTSHLATRLPQLVHLIPNAALAECVVRRLGVAESVISREMIEQTFQACHGDLRETLFKLYDAYAAPRQ